MAEKLFPEVKEDLSGLSDEELDALEQEHRDAAALIDADDESFLKGLSAEQVIAEYERGVEQTEKIVAARAARVEEAANYETKKAELAARLNPQVVEEEITEVKGEDEPASDDPSEPDPEEEVVEEKIEERELVLAAGEPVVEKMAEAIKEEVVRLRRPPAPSPERTVVSEPSEIGTALVASTQFKADHPEPLNQDSLANLVRDVASDLGAVAHDGKLIQRMKVDPWQIDVYPDGRRVEIGGGEMVWDGPKTKVARADFKFPEERTLNGSDDYEKIRAVLPSTVQFLGKPGGHGGQALVASGGLCAPLTPIYSMPNFATTAEPVWDSLPVFRAARGGVNVPAATYIADITTAISSISEANDALGGTFATKTCQALDCPAYTETAVNIFAHCREFGNLNARAWPEKIAHENELTMAALARTTEAFMLDRIKALSINETAAQTLGSLVDLVYAITREVSSIRYLLRMPTGSRFRALLPSWVPELLVADTISTQFDRFRDQASLTAYLRSLGIDPTFYIDTPSTGTSQGFSAAAADAVDDFPDDVQWAIYPEGQFIGIDSGTLELGIVRDSTLNATNDFQIFGERFRNLAMLGPAQGARWITSTVCPTGEFPALATALSCG